VVFTSGIVDDVAPTGVCFSSVLLIAPSGVGVWNLGERSTGEGLGTLLSFEESGRPRSLYGGGWVAGDFSGPPLGARPCDVGGFWLVGWLFVNWIVDASIFAMTLHHGVVAIISPDAALAHVLLSGGRVFCCACVLGWSL
jgi:hypothetical protein